MAVIASRVVKIARYDAVRPDLWAVYDFDPDVTYHIDDDYPYLWVGFDVTWKQSITKDSPGHLLQPEVPPHGFIGNPSYCWRRYAPFGADSSRLAEERRFGYYAFRMTSPCTEQVKCYLWPARLMAPSAFVAMVEEVERELDGVHFSEPSDSAVRQYVRHSKGAPSVERLVDDVQNEIRAARAALRAPYLECLPRAPGELAGVHGVHHRSAGLRDLPEHQLLANWFRRRLVQLDEAGRRARANSYELRRRAAEARTFNEKYYAGIQTIQIFAEKQERRVEEVHGRLIALSRTVEEIGAPGAFVLTPAMQRNPNLRTLLRAFTPPRRETSSVATGPLSMRPPMKAPYLFELWCAVRVVASLRALGWTGALVERRGPGSYGIGGGLDYCKWQLRSGDEELIVELGVQPRVLEFGDIPPATQRSLPAWNWALTAAGGPIGWVSDRACTPDYTMRLYRGQELAVAIGDASLADPKFQHGAKVEKVDQYRSKIAWSTGTGTLVRCAPMGTFTVFPEVSPGSWSTVIAGNAVLDCHVLAFSPGGKDDPAPIAHLVARLRDALRAA